MWSATYPSTSINGSSILSFSTRRTYSGKADNSHKVVLLVDGKPSNLFGALPLIPLDFCNAQNANTPPCYPTAFGNPFYGSGTYPFQTGNTIVIEYTIST